MISYICQQGYVTYSSSEYEHLYFKQCGVLFCEADTREVDTVGGELEFIVDEKIDVVKECLEGRR